MTVTSGRKCFVSFGRLSQLGSLAKMLLESSTWNSEIVFLTWKVRDTTSSVLLFQLAPSTPDTDETECGLWRTPLAGDGTHNHCLSPSVLKGKTTLMLTNQVKGVEAGLWATPNTLDGIKPKSDKAIHREMTEVRPGRKQLSNLGDQVVRGKLWPTPRAKEPGATTEGYGRGLAELVEGKKQKKKLWPTVRASSANGPSQKEIREGNPKGRLETEVVTRMVATPCARDYRDNGKSPSELNRNSEILATFAGGQLAPNFTEYLMGYPKDWTKLN